jgi:hypothetical protein
MTEEMVGGQHRNDESDTDLSVRGEHTKAKERCSSAVTQRVCPEEANTRKKALATADLVRDSSFTGTYQ